MGRAVIPVPYNCYPDLRGCRSHTGITCHQCGESDDVKGLNPLFAAVGSWGIWYCNTCGCTWRYAACLCPDCSDHMETTATGYYCPTCEYTWNKQLIERLYWEGF